MREKSDIPKNMATTAAPGNPVSFSVNFTLPLPNSSKPLPTCSPTSRILEDVDSFVLPLLSGFGSPPSDPEII